MTSQADAKPLSAKGKVHDLFLECNQVIEIIIEIIFAVAVEIKKKIKPKKFKFSVVGDGYIYHLLSDLQGMCKV